LLLEDWRYARTNKRLENQFVERIEDIRSKLKSGTESIIPKEKSVSGTLRELRAVLTPEYERCYKARRASPSWYNLSRHELESYRCPDDLRQLITRSNAELDAICKERGKFALSIEKEKEKARHP